MNEALIAIHDYYKAFSTLELDTCAPFFTLPCMFISPQGTLTAANREDLAKILGAIIEPLRTKDYQRSEFIEPQLTTITANTSLVRGVAIRYRASGAELERVPLSYMVHQTHDRWKISVLIA
jgi:ketosteroid isomerase-like protein